MAQIANTFGVVNAKVNREELYDDVSKIYKYDTPILTMIGTGSTKTTHPEWAIETFGPAVDNARLEGDEYLFDATVPAVRVGNYTQIFGRSAVVSRSQNETENAGNTERMANEKIRKMRLLKRDVEFSILSNTASVAGATRRSGGLPTWVTSNASRGATGANGGFNVGTGLTVTATNGTQRALTKALVDAVMQAAYVSGGEPNTIMVSPYAKSVFVTFMSDANVAPQRMAAEKTKGVIVNGDVESYLSPFGLVSVKVNQLMAQAPALARNVYLLNGEMLSFDYKRKPAYVPNLAVTHDAEKAVAIGEGTLCVKNEAGLGIIADIFGTSAAA